MWLRLDEFGSARNLMQNTLVFDVINPVDSQHDTCMYLQSYLSHVWGQVGLSTPIPKL